MKAVIAQESEAATRQRGAFTDLVWPLIAAALAPVLWLQGRATRRRTPRLPEPPGALAGRVGGNGADRSPVALRVLFVGDSSVAAVGVSDQRLAMPRRVVKALAGSRCVEWTVVAQTGATTRSALEALCAIDLQQFDVAVTALGVNDVTSLRGLGPWLDEQRNLRELLRDRTGVRRIVCCGLPPVRSFPALPQPLRWVLGVRAEQFSEALARDLAEEADVEFLPLDFATDVAGMASDGFHPGEPIYAAWAEQLSSLLESN